MNKFRFTLKIAAIATFLFAFASFAQAQATRTWVSGVGDDANPCSRTAPCKTFAGAISKTAAGGEISVLDPGGFGTVTITKSITLNGTHGSGFAGILSAGATAGIIINNAAAIVRLNALDINGAGTGTDGIRINAAAKVYINDCKIDGLTNRGINDIRSTAGGFLVVKDTIVTGCTQSGIVVIPAGGSVTVTIENSASQGSVSNSGYAQSGTVKGTLTNSIFTGNNQNGIFADSAGGEINIAGCVSNHNGTGLFVGAPGVARLSGTQIENNTISINAAGQVQVSSDGTNTIAGNGANNLPTGPPITPAE
jgi:hypothetical protein